MVDGKGCGLLVARRDLNGMSGGYIFTCSLNGSCPFGGLSVIKGGFARDPERWMLFALGSRESEIDVKLFCLM